MGDLRWLTTIGFADNASETPPVDPSPTNLIASYDGEDLTVTWTNNGVYDELSLENTEADSPDFTSTATLEFDDEAFLDEGWGEGAPPGIYTFRLRADIGEKTYYSNTDTVVIPDP